MANLFDEIEKALQPADPWAPLKVLATETKFVVPESLLKERARVIDVYKSAMARMEQIGSSVQAAVDEERRSAREEVESGPPYVGLRTKKEIREEIHKECRLIKVGLIDILSDFAELCRPEVQRFEGIAVSHIDAMENLEREEYDKFGVPYVRTSLICALRRRVDGLADKCIPPRGALNSPRSYLPWLPENL